MPEMTYRRITIYAVSTYKINIGKQAKIIEILRSLGIETDDILNMSEEAFARFKDEYIGILADIYSGNDSMLSVLSDTTGRSVDEMDTIIFM